MINFLIPLVIGLLLVLKPEMFIKKDDGTFESKKLWLVKIGKGLLGAAALLFLSMIFISLGEG